MMRLNLQGYNRHVKICKQFVSLGLKARTSICFPKQEKINVLMMK